MSRSRERSRSRGWAQGQGREQGREPGREPGQEQAGQAAGGGLFACARKGAGDHQMRGGWGPSSDVLVAVRKLPCDCRALQIWCHKASCAGVFALDCDAEQASEGDN